MTTLDLGPKLPQILSCSPPWQDELGLWVDVCMAGVVGTIFEVVSGCLTDFVDGSFGATTIFLVNFDLV